MDLPFCWHHYQLLCHLDTATGPLVKSVAVIPGQNFFKVTSARYVAWWITMIRVWIKSQIKSSVTKWHVPSQSRMQSTDRKVKVKPGKQVTTPQFKSKLELEPEISRSWTKAGRKCCYRGRRDLARRLSSYHYRWHNDANPQQQQQQWHHDFSAMYGHVDQDNNDNSDDDTVGRQIVAQQHDDDDGWSTMAASARLSSTRARRRLVVVGARRQLPRLWTVCDGRRRLRV